MQRQRSSSFVTTTVNNEAESTIAATQTAKVEEVEDSESSEEEEDLEDFGGDDQLDLQGFEDAMNEECKLVLVVRTDLGMTKGVFHNITVSVVLKRANHVAELQER